MVLKRLHLPIIPTILGMVLGNIAEAELRSALPRIDGPFDFVDRPVAAIIFVFIPFVILVQA